MSSQRMTPNGPNRVMQTTANTTNTAKVIAVTTGTAPFYRQRPR